jgi:hypothetical protein
MHIAKVLLNLITENREKQELAFRGHNENENSVNLGNFRELAKLLSRRQYVYQNEDVDMEIFTGSRKLTARTQEQDPDGRRTVVGHVRRVAEEDAKHRQGA